MKKFLTVVTIMMLAVSVTSAQDIWGQGKMRAGVGGQLSLSMNDFWGLGFGGFGKFEYGINEDMAIQGSIGFLTYGEKEVTVLSGFVTQKNTGTAIPIIATFKYNLSKHVTPGLYGLAEYGIWNLTQTIKAGTVSSGITFTGAGDYTSSPGVLGIGVGYDTGMLDASAKFLVNQNFNQIVVGVAYNFGL